MRKALLFIGLIVSPAMGLDTVSILPLDGPVGTVKISPANGSATAYLMNYPGQKSICFKNNATTDVYFSSSTTAGTNGFPFKEIGDNLCLDLKGGTTIYFYGDGAGGDVRAVFSR